MGNKFDLFLKNLFANYSVHTETKWRSLSIQLKIRDVPRWRNFLEKLLESRIIAEFPKCELFNWKIPKFLVEYWQMQIPVWVYLARFFSLFLEITAPFHDKFSEIQIRSFDPMENATNLYLQCTWISTWVVAAKQGKYRVAGNQC